MLLASNNYLTTSSFKEGSSVRCEVEVVFHSDVLKVEDSKIIVGHAR